LTFHEVIRLAIRSADDVEPLLARELKTEKAEHAAAFETQGARLNCVAAITDTKASARSRFRRGM
jgi:hypothetical protein